MAHIIQEIRLSLSSLARSPGFTLVSVLTLALGIGASTSIFSVVNSVLLRQLPFPNANELVGIWNTAPGFGFDILTQSETTYTIFREFNDSFVDIGLVDERTLNLVGDGEPIRIEAASATASMFRVLGISPAHGRAFDEADDQFGSPNVVIISDELWRSRYGSDPDILGQTLNLDDEAWEIVGIMPPTFDFPRVHTKLWVPHRIDPTTLGQTDFRYQAVGRLKPGVSLEAAEADLDRVLTRLPEFSPGELTLETLEEAQFASVVHTMMDDVVGEVRQTLWILLGTVGFILLIACANVANLFLVRAEGRRREVALRSALGAGRLHLVRYFMTESVILGLLGGALGLFLAFGGIRVLLALDPDIPRLNEVGIDGYALAFSVFISITAGLVFALVPIAKYGQLNLNTTLKDGGHGASTGLEIRTIRSGLVVSQIALALVLLVGSGLMALSFWQLKNVNPGIEPEGLLTMRISLPPAKYSDANVAAVFYEQLLDSIRALPGVQSAGAITNFPMTDSANNEGLYVEDFVEQPGDLPPLARTNLATPGYFEAVGVPVQSGRLFERHFDEQGVLVSAAFEERFWPGQSALGRRLSRREGGRDIARWYPIVGVVGDIRDDGLSAEVPEMVYFPPVTHDPEGAARTTRTMTVAIRTAGPPIALAEPARKAVWAIDPQLPVANVRTAENIVSESTQRMTFTLLLLGLAAIVALLLGAVGIYGVISYLVSQRTQEIGVRMALGADRGSVVSMVVRHGIWISLTGITIGLLGAWALTRLIETLLFDVSATDPLIYFGVSAFVLTVSVLASYLPARRAARVSPVEALRHQ